MKVRITDHTEYVDKVNSMIEYFDILDSAGVDGQEIAVQEVPLGDLRADEHAAYGDALIRRLYNYKGAYVRAPRMP